MIRIENLSKSFPDGDLFNNVNIFIKSRMRLGLVGPNGSGKTTLLRIMLGKETPDAGNIQLDKSTTIGYLYGTDEYNNYEEVCYTDTIVTEYYCQDNRVMEVNYPCGDNETCSNGACSTYT